MNTADRRIRDALDELGTRTGCEVAKVHALLAIAEAILEAGQPDDFFRNRAYFGGVAYPETTPQDAPHATHSHEQPNPVPQDQPAPERALDAKASECPVMLIGQRCRLPKGHPELHEVQDVHHVIQFRPKSGGPKPPWESYTELRKTGW